MSRFVFLSSTLRPQFQSQFRPPRRQEINMARRSPKHSVYTVLYRHSALQCALPCLRTSFSLRQDGPTRPSSVSSSGFKVLSEFATHIYTVYCRLLLRASPCQLWQFSVSLCLSSCSRRACCAYCSLCRAANSSVLFCTFLVSHVSACGVALTHVLACGRLSSVRARSWARPGRSL